MSLHVVARSAGAGRAAGRARYDLAPGKADVVLSNVSPLSVERLRALRSSALPPVVVESIGGWFESPGAGIDSDTRRDLIRIWSGLHEFDRKGGVEADRYVVSLPRGLGRDGCLLLARRLAVAAAHPEGPAGPEVAVTAVVEEVDRLGAGDPDSNPHVQILSSRIPLDRPVRRGEKVRATSLRDWPERYRAETYRLAREALVEAGREDEIDRLDLGDHRSFARRGLLRMPGLHRGPRLPPSANDRTLLVRAREAARGAARAEREAFRASIAARAAAVLSSLPEEERDIDSFIESACAAGFLDVSARGRSVRVWVRPPGSRREYGYRLDRLISDSDESTRAIAGEIAADSLDRTGSRAHARAVLREREAERKPRPPRGLSLARLAGDLVRAAAAGERLARRPPSRPARPKHGGRGRGLLSEVFKKLVRGWGSPTR